MNITHKLVQEHQLILNYIELLQEYLIRLRDERHEDLLESLNQFIDFIQNYADKYHHAKEENILFKYMEQPGVLTHCNPLPVMLNEHDEGRHFIKQLQSAIKTKNKSAAIINAHSWAELLKNHISKEDNVLYEMAEEGLNEIQKIEISKAYAKVESEMGGQKLEEKYQELFSLLKSGISNSTEICA